MRKVILQAICIMFYLPVFSQNSIEIVLQQIEENNTSLKALVKQQEAQALLNTTGIYLPDPEFDFAWFAGSPENIGSKTNISLVQSFDFPTAYRHRNRIARARNEQLGPEYRRQRSELLLEAHITSLEIIYTNILLQEYGRRIQHAEGIAGAYTRMLDEGHANILDYNKARLSLLNLQKEAELVSIKNTQLTNRLAAMNAGKEILLPDTIFPPVEIHSDFGTWYEDSESRDPVLQWFRQEVEISSRQEKLQKALNLPGLAVGYVSEELTHEQFRGFVVGVSIPLWENKNTLRHARSHTLALESAEHDTRLMNYHLLKSLHTKAQSLQQAIAEYRQLLPDAQSIRLLNRALEEGQISLANYLLELSFFYQSTERIMEMELELQQTVASLNQYFY